VKRETEQKNDNNPKVETATSPLLKTSGSGESDEEAESSCIVAVIGSTRARKKHQEGGVRLHYIYS
jgi:hypothetical protein